VSAVLLDEETRFRSSSAALRFYCDATPANYEMSTLADFVGPARPFGRGLGGLEGAGERGMIGSNLDTLPQLWRRILRARYTKPEIPCYCLRPCCAEFRINPAWALEVVWIGATVMVDLAPKDERSVLRQKPTLREDIVSRYFGRRYHGRKLSNKEMANRSKVSERSVSTFTHEISSMLRKEEKRAEEAIDDRLRTAKLVGD
jgi:hypothetical protein